MNTTPDFRDSQLLGLSAFLQLEKDVRHAANQEEFNFIVTNETRRLLQYEQAIMWKFGSTGSVQICAVSGLAQIDKNAPFIVWLKSLIGSQCKHSEATSTRPVNMENIDSKYQEGWKEWCSGNVLWAPMLDNKGNLVGGLWFTRNTVWESHEAGLIDRLMDAYAHALAALTGEQNTFLTQLHRNMSSHRVRLVVLVLFILAMFFPVSQTVLAPAEVIAVNPVIVSSPVEGVVKKFHVTPNANVDKGALLFSLDDTTIRNQHEIAIKALDVTKADYLRAAQKAFSDEKSKGEVSQLRARVDQKSEEVKYTAEILERINVRAEQPGIAIFSDQNDFIGKPVRVGEKILTLARTDASELKIWLPADDAINLQNNAEVLLFLNIDPTNPLDATLRQTSYEAQLTPDGILAFPLKAGFIADGVAPRIGLKGTAKIYGQKVSLFYYLMRRPIAAVRQFLGI